MQCRGLAVLAGVALTVHSGTAFARRALPRVTIVAGWAVNVDTWPLGSRPVIGATRFTVTIRRIGSSLLSVETRGGGRDILEVFRAGELVSLTDVEGKRIVRIPVSAGSTPIGNLKQYGTHQVIEEGVESVEGVKCRRAVTRLDSGDDHSLSITWTPVDRDMENALGPLRTIEEKYVNGQWEPEHMVTTVGLRFSHPRIRSQRKRRNGGK